MTAGFRRAAVIATLIIAVYASVRQLYHPALAALHSALEQRFNRAHLQDHDQIAGIVVLGGGPARFYEAARLGARFPGVPVILSGADRSEQAAAESKVALAGRLVIDPRPKNTFENALYSKEFARGKSSQRWILVTSAIHMPRAMGAFRAVGFAVEPWPVFDRAPRGEEQEASVLHEIAGLIAYRILGRSRSLYPAP